MLKTAIRHGHIRVVSILRQKLVRDAGWIAISHGVTILVGLMSIRLFTELAPPSVFGGSNLLIGMLTLGMNALVAPIAQTQIRYHLAHSDAGNGDRYTWAIAKLTALAALFLCILTCALLIGLPAFGARKPAMFVLIPLWIVVSAWRGVLINRVQAERHQQRYAFWLASEAIAILIATVAALHISSTVESFIAGQIIGTALACLAFGRLPKRDAKTNEAGCGNFDASVRRQITRYGSPFLPFALLGWTSNLSDRYVLAIQLDTSIVGQYAAAFGIASRLPSMLSGLLNDVFRPALFEAETRGQSARCNRLFQIWLLVLGSGVAAILIALLLAGSILVDTLLAEEYRMGAREIILWIVAGYGCGTLAQVVENRILASGNSRVLIWTKVAAAVTNLAMALLLIPSWGVVGAAMANTAGQATLLIITVGTLWLLENAERQKCCTSNKAPLRTI